MTTPSHNSSASGLRRVGRVFIKIVIGILAFLILVILLIQAPPIQNFARKKVVAFLENKLKTEVSIGKINIGIPNKILLENIYLEDRQKDTLLSGGRISANLDMFKLLSNNVQINSLAIEGVTAKIKRVLPDTIFNFQFVVDAFAPKPTTSTKTTVDTAAMEMSIDDVTLDKIRIVYSDVVTGSDMNVWLEHFETDIKEFNAVKQVYNIAYVELSGVTANIYQRKPLVTSEPISKDLAEAAAPIPFDLEFGEVKLDKIKLNYENDVSAFYTNLDIGTLSVNSKDIDLQNRVISLDQLLLNNSNTIIRLGKKEEARKVIKEVKQEVKSEAQNDWRFVVSKIELNKNSIQYDNDNMPRLSYGMDYAHLKAEDLTLHANDFVFTLDSIAAQITRGNFREKSGFQLNTLQTKFVYSAKETSLQDLVLETPGTSLRRTAILRYPSLETFTKNIGSLQMDIDIENGRIQTKDILVFAPDLRNQPMFRNRFAVWHLNTRITGAVNNLNIHELQFRGFQNTRADVRGRVVGLPDMNRLQANLVINQLSTNKSDLLALMPKGSIPPNITLPDRMDVEGTINGNTASMKTNLDIRTNLGSASVNGTFSNFTSPTAIGYNANIATRSLNVGRIIQNEAFIGTVTANIRANGRGFDPKTANATFNGKIHSAVINKYNYQNVDIDGKVANQQATAKLNISDPNIDLTIDAESDLSSTYPGVKFTASIDSIKTMPLNFTPQPVFYHGKITGNFPVTDPARLTGEMLITQSFLVTPTARLQLDTIQLAAGKGDSGQFIRMNSDFVNLHMYGQYNLVQLGSVFQQAIQPYFEIVPGYKMVPTDPYDFKIVGVVVNSPALQVFMPDLVRLEPMHINSHFSSTAGWNANIKTPMIVYGVNHIENVNLEAGTANGAIQLKASVSHLKSGTTANIYNTSLTATVANNIVDFIVNIKDKTSKDKYNLAATFNQSQQRGTYVFSFKPGALMLNYQQWNVSNGNSIQFGTAGVLVNNFVLSNNSQQITINSQSATPNSPLTINFGNFRLATITGFVQEDSVMVDGVLNGNVQLSNFATVPTFVSDLTVNDLSLYKDTLGNARIEMNNLRQNIYNANITLTGRGNDVVISGNYYQPPNDNESFALTMDVRAIQLNTIEGATMGAISNAKGTLSGKLGINGTFEKPMVNGTLNFNDAGFHLGVLNSYFTISQETITINQAGVLFDSFTINDSLNNDLVLDGYVYTSNFANYRYDLYINADNFRAINSTKRQNDLYYGQLFFDTELHIAGTEALPVVDGAITINDETDFTVVIPQQQAGVLERDGIVRFVDMDSVKIDTATFARHDSLNNSGIRGMDLSVNITVVKEATFSLVVDEANGDFVRIQGEAELTAGIDKSGKVSLTGSYEIDNGAYEISFNLLRREFQIQKGSRIIWLGEPTLADVNVTAVYRTNTAPLPLVQQYVVRDEAYYKQKVPFEVHLKLTGQLLTPDISFDITQPTNRSYAQAGFITEAIDLRLEQLRQEPSEMTKQVFAVLLMNRFINDNPFEGSGGGFNAGMMARQSVSKILAEQLNDLAADLIKGVDINFDVVSFEDYSKGTPTNRTDLNVSLSKQLLNDRLKVTVGNNFELEGGQGTTQRSSGNGLAGNVALDYQLSRDGKYMIRAYRQNEYEGQIEGYIIETGVRFIITLDYNHFRDLFRKKKKPPVAPTPTTTTATQEVKETTPVPDAKLNDEPWFE